jgi:FMN reductase
MVQKVARVAVVIGHPRPASRTHRVAARTGQLLADRLYGGPDCCCVDLAALGPRLLDGRRAGTMAADALATVSSSRVVVPVSPTVRGAYSGLLKLFLDMLPRQGLSGCVVVPMMTAGLPAHRYVVEMMLRPVLVELDAEVPVPGISVMESSLGHYDEVFEHWWNAYGCLLRRMLGAPEAVRC